MHRARTPLAVRRRPLTAPRGQGNQEPTRMGDRLFVKRERERKREGVCLQTSPFGKLDLSLPSFFFFFYSSRASSFFVWWEKATHS